MMSCLLCLAILQSCLSHGQKIPKNRIFDDDGMVLNMLQVQAQPLNTKINLSAGESRQPKKIHALMNQTFPRQIQVETSFFQKLEQEGAQLGLEDGIAVVVPGFGDPERAEVLKKNIAWLKTQDVPFDCVIYVYRSESEFPISAQDYAPCKLIRNLGYWMDHVRAFPLNQSRRRWVLHMVDSIEVHADVRLKRMIDIMKANGLRHAAPTFPIYNKYSIMAQDVTSEGPGRLVNFIELQLDLFSRDYFACLQDIIDDDNMMGWGMDRVLASLCEGKKGLLDEMTIHKMFTGSYDWDDAQESMAIYFYRLGKKFPQLTVFDPLNRSNNHLSQLKEPLDAVTDRAIPNLAPPNSSKFRMLEQKGAQDGLEDGIALIITGVAGFGDYKRCPLVKSNIAWMQSQGIPFECTIYVYYATNDFILVDDNYAPCKLVRLPGYRMDHLRHFSLNRTRRRWVLHMRDNIQPDANVKLGRMIDIMRANGLSHAAPTLPIDQRFLKNPIMGSRGNASGRMVSFIKFQMDMFSREHFACLQDMISDDNGIGWGLDMLMPSFCGGKRGLIDEMTVTQRYQELGREADFQRHVGIMLGQFVTKFPGLPLANTNTTYSELMEPLKSNASHPLLSRLSSTGHSQVAQLPSVGLVTTEQAIPNLVPPNTTKFRLLEREGSISGLEAGVAVILPGIESSQQARSAKKNIAWVKTQGIPFECTIYFNRTFKDLREQDFAPCKVVIHSGHWLDHLRAFSLMQTRRSWVLHMMEGIEPQADVNLSRMIGIMKANSLSHAAPTFPTYDRYPIMATVGQQPGRMVSFIELHMDMFSREYFACLQDTVSEDNGRGFGIDMLLPSLCNGRRGLIDEMSMLRNSTEPYRWDEADRTMGILLGELAVKFPGVSLADRNTTYSELVEPDKEEHVTETN
mmetsp:Transcript_55816/g.102388  ORF Transcript_55816/g.102388 Transcript_55816/m.102388 type:complete len:909 (+) Transcript_55816:86-2812(+)